MRAAPELVAAACGGDAAAVEKLLAVCQPDMRRFATRICSTSEDAEDAVQVALWQLYRHVGALRTMAAFTGWLFRIIERECRRLFRAGRQTVPWDEKLDEMPAQALPVELRLDLAAAIAAMPVASRQILVLRDIEGFSAPETAARLGISVETVKSRLHRARMALREHLLASDYWEGSQG